MNENTALLIIDVQMVMFAEGDAVYNGNEVLERLQTLIRQARLAGVPVIYVQHNGTEDNDPLLPDQPGWSLHPAIQPEPNDKVIQKYHPDSFQGTTLKSELDSLGIENLVIAGMQTEYCIDTTCRRAYSLGYQVTLVQDGHSTWDTRNLKATQVIAHHNQVLGNAFVTLKNSDEVVF